jgi:hypothetical protein
LEGQAPLVLLVHQAQQVKQVLTDQVLHQAQQAQVLQQAQQVRALITQPKIPITITRIGMLVINFILTLFIPLDQKHIMQVIHTHFTHMGIMLIITTMAVTIQTHLICRTLPIQTVTAMPLLMF